MSSERFGIGGDGDAGVWTATPIYLDSLVDTAVDSPTDGFVLTYEASSGKWKPTAAGAGADTKTEVYEAGVQVGTVARAINFDGDDFNVTEEAGPGYFTVTFAGTGMSAHDMTGAYHTEDATGGVGNVLRATGATAFAWAQLGHGDLGGVTPDLHHAQSHVLSGGDHSASGLTIGDAIMADSPTTFSWQTPSYYNNFTTDFAAESLANLTTRAHSDLSDAPTDAHHSESHALDAAVHTGSLPWSDLDLTSSSLADLATRAHGNLSDAPTDAHHTEGHVLAVTGPHTGSLPLTDLDPSGAAQGSMMRYGVSDWEVLTRGTNTYVLKAGAATIAWGQVDYSELAGTQPDPVAHVLATTGPHSDTLPLTDLDVGTQGSIIRRGAVDWEEYVLGTTNYVLKAGATDVAWGQVDYSELTGTQPDPVAHTLAGALHTATSLTVGWVIAADSATTFSWQAPSGGTDDDAIHDNVAQEIQPITGKGSPVGADVILIEDSADSWNKKSVTITNLPGGADADAIHDNVDNEIQPITPKGAPVGADVVLIEDSAASWAKKSVLISNLPAGSPSFGVPSGNIDIGDSAAEGSSGDSTRADHQHQFSAPGAGYPLDTANTESDGTATTPARSDHIHALGAHIHTATAGEGGTLTWVNALAAAAAGSHDHSDNTKGDAVPESSVTFSATGHSHDGTGSENVTYTNLDSIPSSFTPAAHVLAVTGPHTGELPWADMAVGTQGGIVRRGAADWEEYALGTENYVLKAGATDVAWGQVDFSELTGSVPSHGSSQHSSESDAEAIHDNVDGEINAIGVKGSPVGADIIVIEDSAATWAKKKITISTLPAGSPSFGVPSGNIDIGDAAVEGSSGDSTRADHQHQFSAPTASYPVQIDIGDSLIDGAATTPARSDHGHAFPAPSAGYPLDIAAAEDDGTSTTPARADHVHAHPSGLGVDLHHSETHALATSGPHTDTLPLADLAVGTQGGIIRRGAADWEEFAKGAQYQYLRAGASDVEWQARTFTIATTIKSPTVGYTTVWRAPFGCTCTKLEGRQKGGTSTIINARYNGTTDVATGDLTLTAADTWYDTTGINQTAWSATDWLEIEVQTLGSATEITFVLTFTEP